MATQQLARTPLRSEPQQHDTDTLATPTAAPNTTTPYNTEGMTTRTPPPTEGTDGRGDAADATGYDTRTPTGNRQGDPGDSGGDPDEDDHGCPDTPGHAAAGDTHHMTVWTWNTQRTSHRRLADVCDELDRCLRWDAVGLQEVSTYEHDTT